MTADMRQALTERRDLIEARAQAILDHALNDDETWTTALGTPPESTAQKIDAARAGAALDRARDLSHGRETTSDRPARREAARRAL